MVVHDVRPVATGLYQHAIWNGNRFFARHTQCPFAAVEAVALLPAQHHGGEGELRVRTSQGGGEVHGRVAVNHYGRQIHLNGKMQAVVSKSSLPGQNTDALRRRGRYRKQQDEKDND